MQHTKVSPELRQKYRCLKGKEGKKGLYLMAVTTRDNFLNIYQRPFISVNSSYNIQTQACSFANRDNLKCTVTRRTKRKKSRITSQMQVIKIEAITCLHLTGFANMYYSNKQKQWTFNFCSDITLFTTKSAISGASDNYKKNQYSVSQG